MAQRNYDEEDLEFYIVVCITIEVLRKHFELKHKEQRAISASLRSLNNDMVHRTGNTSWFTTMPKETLLLLVNLYTSNNMDKFLLVKQNLAQ